MSDTAPNGTRPVLAIVDPIHPEGVAILRAAGEVVELFSPGTDAERGWARADGLVISTSQMTAASIAGRNWTCPLGPNGVRGWNRRAAEVARIPRDSR